MSLSSINFIRSTVLDGPVQLLMLSEMFSLSPPLAPLTSIFAAVIRSYLNCSINLDCYLCPFLNKGNCSFLLTSANKLLLVGLLGYFRYCRV